MKIKQEMIDKIYEKVANKKWTFWCKFKMKWEKYPQNYTIIKAQPNWSSSEYIENWIVKSPKNITCDIKPTQFIYIVSLEVNYIDFKKVDKDEHFYCNVITIWHPVMIWDVLDYINTKSSTVLKYINEDWKNKRLPIEEQSKECIEYVYNLIKE